MPAVPDGVKVRFPFVALTAGATENRPAFVSPVTMKLSTWPDSLGAPGEMFVAQPGTVTAPALELTDWSLPLLKLGA